MADHPPPHSAGAHSFLDDAFGSLRGLGVRRNPDDRWLAGVCSGVADRLGIDPLIVRGVLIVLVFVGGVGGLAYLVAWALMPDHDGRILAEDALHGHGWGIVLLVVIGIVVVSNVVDRWWLWLILVPIGLLSWWAVASARAGKTPEQMSEELRGYADRVAGSLGSPGGVPTASVPPPRRYAGSSPAPDATGPSPSEPMSGVQPGGPYACPPSSPHAMGPGRSGAVAAPPRVVHRNRRRGGLLALLLTAGLAVAAYGVGSPLATDRAWPGSHELVGAAFALAGGGVALVVVGLAGRRAGFSVLLVTALAAVTVLGTSLPNLPHGGFGERTWLASAPPAGGFMLTAGEARLSLADATTGQPVRVEMGAGELTVHVPVGTVVEVSAVVHVGQVSVQRMTGTQEFHSGRAGSPETISTSVGSGAAHVPLEIRLGAGQVTIVEDA